jgi:imidazolonepropionase-like amidohydrolase
VFATIGRFAGIVMLAGTTAAGSLAGQTTALVGATLIDGTGAPPLENAVVVVEGARIVRVGRRGDVRVPRDATVIDAEGTFLVPGFVDTNVHLSLYGGNTTDRHETLVRYEHRQHEVVLEAAQMQLRHGVTTVRDSYGMLVPIRRVRDSIAAGHVVGPRILVAGNIVGWGGPFSLTFSLIPSDELSLFQERMNDAIAQDAGEDLMAMTPEELRGAINAYLDKGVDFVKYGGTAHFDVPALIGFSPAQQAVMVGETHARGLVAETHATSSEGLRLAVEAGIDVIQHPEIIMPATTAPGQSMPDALVAAIVDRGIVCSMLSNTITGVPWQRHLERDVAAADSAVTGHVGTQLPRMRSRQEDWNAFWESGEFMDMRRRNAEKLIAAGCITTVGTDNYRRTAPELARGPKPEWQDHGIGTILGIEGLVELGMTPMQAIVAATANGAKAARMADDLGTVEEGKLADLLLLGADPLADITNIRRLELVMANGIVVDRGALPTVRVFTRDAPAAARSN